MMSVVSIATSAASIGVASRRPPSWTMNAGPRYSSVVGTSRRTRRRTGFRSGATACRFRAAFIAARVAIL
jgi:hypothetical protein